MLVTIVKKQPVCVCLAVLGVVALLAGCEEPLPDMRGVESQTVRVTTDNFTSVVAQSDLPVVVDFGAAWCGPCREMDPYIALLSVEYQGRVKVGKVDVDEEPELSDRFTIDSVPTVILFQDGLEVGRAVGSMGYRSLERWLGGHVTL